MYERPDIVNPTTRAADRRAESRAVVKSFPKRLRQKARRRMKRTSGLGRRWIGRLQSGETITPDIPGAQFLLVWLDGVAQDGVTALNAREGWIERYVKGPDGELLVDPERDCIATERVHGKVSLKMGEW